MRFFAEGKKDPERKRAGETVCVCKRESMMPESVIFDVVFPKIRATFVALILGIKT